MSAGCLAERFGLLVPLTPAERQALERLELRERVLRRGATPIAEKERQTELFVLKRGMMMSYVLLDDGRRQILRFLSRGDLFGWSAVAYARAPATVAALTDAVVCPIGRAQTATLFVEHPRLAALLLAINQVERVAMTDRLAALGRASAKTRVAMVLVEIVARQRRDEDPARAAALRLTQEEIGDATGLTAVHVNRMLRQLEKERLIAREGGGRVSLVDEAGLARLANFVDRNAGLDLGWLPPAR